MLDKDFWLELISKFQSKGYDVFMNLTGKEFELENTLSYKTCNLTFSEVFALARLSKKIISLRSGLTEFLIQTGVSMDVLYTKFKQRPIFAEMDTKYIMSGFGIKQIPMTDKYNIREFNMDEISQDLCIEKILKQSEEND